MFIELTEFLRCPKDHEEAHAVCLPLEMAGRDVVRGVVGCPQCQAEYVVVDGVVDFAERTSAPGHRGTDAPGHRGTGAPTDAGTDGGGAGDDSGASVRRCAGAPAVQLTAESLAILLDLRGPGGFLLLAGDAARLAADLVPLVPDVHIVCANAAEGVARAPGCSFLRTPGRVPLTTSSMRAVVLGADVAAEPWLAEGVRVLLRGLRLVVENERASPAGIAELARGAGLLVGEKRDR